MYSTEQITSDEEAMAIIKQEIDYTEMLSSHKEINLEPGYFTWGTEGLDNAFGRYNKGILSFIVGESGSGKTEFSIFMGTENAKRNKKVMFISLEMATSDIFRNLAVRKLGCTKKQIDAGLDDAKRNRILDKIEEIKKIGLNITGMAAETTIENIMNLIRSAKKDGYEMFIIDSLDQIQTKDKNDADRISNITREMKRLVNTENIQLTVIHHFTKGSNKDRKAGRGLASIRGSGKVENNADLIIQVARDLGPDEEEYAEPIERAKVNITMMKDRVYGDRHSVPIFFKNGNYHDTF